MRKGGDREGGMKRGREVSRQKGRKRGKEEAREGGREERKEGGREARRQRGKEAGRQRGSRKRGRETKVKERSEIEGERKVNLHKTAFIKLRMNDVYYRCPHVSLIESVASRCV